MVYRKIIRRLVPFLFLCYAAAYLDRVNLSFAQLQLQDDLAFSDTVYGVGAAMFFISRTRRPRSTSCASHSASPRRASSPACCST